MPLSSIDKPERMESRTSSIGRSAFSQVGSKVSNIQLYASFKEIDRQSLKKSPLYGGHALLLYTRVPPTTLNRSRELQELYGSVPSLGTFTGNPANDQDKGPVSFM